MTLARLSAKEQLRQMVRGGATFAIHEPAGAEVAREIKRWAGDEYSHELTPADIEQQLRRGKGGGPAAVGPIGGGCKDRLSGSDVLRHALAVLADAAQKYLNVEADEPAHETAWERWRERRDDHRAKLEDALQVSAEYL